MTKFQNLYESLLLEMPHISFEMNGKHFDFDLELEKHQKDWYGLVRLMHNILGSKSVKDKYGNVLSLSTREEKETFIEELRNNPMFNAFIKRFYNKDFDDLLDLSHQTPKINISHKNNTTPFGSVNYGKGVSGNLKSSMGDQLPSGNSSGI